jgi:hypothetical protein
MTVGLLPGGGLGRRVTSLVIAVALAALAAPAQAEGDPAAYRAAVPALERAGGGKTCVQCFLERYAPAVFNKAFAVSADGAYGGRWGRGLSMEQVRREALESCRRKPEFNPANPCAIFFENDRLVWRP